MVKIILLLMMVSPFYSISQEEERIPGKGMLRTRGSLAQGVLLKHQDYGTRVFLQGDLEYYASDNISVRSDNFFDIEGLPEGWKTHQHFTGIMFHPGKAVHFDPFLGVQPGISLSTGNSESPARFNPIIGLMGGVHYYARKYFHLSANAQYIYGKDVAPYSVIYLDEIRFSFGLGINLNVLKIRR